MMKLIFEGECSQEWNVAAKAIEQADVVVVNGVVVKGPLFGASANTEDVKAPAADFFDKKPSTVRNPYYIGSGFLLRPSEQVKPGTVKRGANGNCYKVQPVHAKHTLQDAINEAKRRLAADPKLDAISVVKIVRVVRRAKPVVDVDVEVVE
jgi:hypothetical protein